MRLGQLGDRPSEGDTEILGKCDDLLGRIERVKTAQETVTLELLDPIGHSQILLRDATSTEISEEQAGSWTLVQFTQFLTLIVKKLIRVWG